MDRPGLTNNQLKILAMITMTLDHVGMVLLPHMLWLRIIGRLAMPIYAYMIAEGCHHTRSMPRYLGTMAAMAALCQIVYLFAMGSLYMSILVTFSLSIGLILLIKQAMENPTPVRILGMLTGFAGAFFLCEILPRMLPGTDYGVDYGFIGVLLPVCIWLGRDKDSRLLITGTGLACLSYVLGGIQWYSLLTVPLLCLYNGQRGKWKIKWFFYLFYPVHLVVIHAISLIL